MSSGVYLLLLRVQNRIIVKIGSLGRLSFSKGYYVYAGSGQNNVLKRVERHLSNNKKLHWHIDYLLSSNSANIESAYIIRGSKALECALSVKMLKLYTPVLGFGCSDCTCSSHLFKVSKKSFIKNLSLLVYG